MTFLKLGVAALAALGLLSACETTDSGGASTSGTSTGGMSTSPDSAGTAPTTPERTTPRAGPYSPTFPR